MNKDGKPEDKEVEIDDESTEEQVKGDKEVDITEKDETDKEPSEKDETAQEMIDRLKKLEKQTNNLYYLGRKLDEANRQLEELKKSGIPVKTQEAEEDDSEDDKYDKLVKKGEWKGAVRGIASEVAQEILKSQEILHRQEEEKQEKVDVLEQNKKTVREKYPDLDDADSENAQRYMKVLNNNPTFIHNVHGPVLAMYKMEEELRSEGKLDEDSQMRVDREISRRSRVSATSTPKGSPTSSNKVVLTREEQEICKHNNIPVQDFAKMKKKLNSGKEGVSV